MKLNGLGMLVLALMLATACAPDMREQQRMDEEAYAAAVAAVNSVPAEPEEPAMTNEEKLKIFAELTATANQHKTEYNVDNCVDCSGGHEAGYEWAEDNYIEDPGDCGGQSDAFIEGCEEYAEEQQEALRQEAEAEESEDAEEGYLGY